MADRSGGLSFAQGSELLCQFCARRRAESRVDGALELREQTVGALVCGATAVGDGGANRPAVVGIRHPRNEAVGLEPINELRDVRLAAAVPFRQMGQRQWLGGQHQVAECAKFGERQTDLGEGAFGTRFHGAGGVEEEEGEGAPGRGGSAATVGHAEGPKMSRGAANLN